MTKPAFLDGLRPTLHISHRGGAALAPENTLFAFVRAVEKHRTDMLELDVHLTRDGRLVVAHDPTLERMTDGTGPIAARTLEELRELDAGHGFTPDGGRTYPYRGRGICLPSFEEVLQRFPSLRMNVELKPDEPEAAKVLAALVRREGASGRLCLGSESDAQAERLRAELPEGCFFYPREALTAVVMSARLAQTVPDAPWHVLDMPLWWEGMRLVDEPFLQTCTKAGKWVNVWTVDDEAELRQCLAEGVGGIMTDRPDLLRALLG